MSWLYERRDQLDGLRPFVEIAHRLIFPVPSHDQDDVEQEIVITLKRVTDQRGELAINYLWGVARNVVRLYWRRRYRQAKRVKHLCENNRGEMVAGEWKYISDDGDSDARLDAQAVLATLPIRLVKIGHKRMNGERLSEADEWYWMRHKKELGCRQRGDQLSAWEKRRIVHLHHQGMSVSRIARTMGRGRKTIDLCLVKEGLREAPPYLASKG